MPNAYNVNFAWGSWNLSYNIKIYERIILERSLINHVSTKVLTTGLVIRWVTDTPSAEVSTKCCHQERSKQNHVSTEVLTIELVIRSGNDDSQAEVSTKCDKNYNNTLYIQCVRNAVPDLPSSGTLKLNMAFI